jgi:putative MATE family efflux protein
LEQQSLATKKLFTNQDLFRLFLPLIIEQFLEYLVGLVDSIMVAHVGESAVSGVSLVDFVMALLISLFAALSTGGAVIAGQYMGRKQMEEAREAANQLVWFSGAISVIIMVIIYLAKPFILNGLFGQITDEVRTEANTYLMITAASIPFLALYNAGAAVFRTMGNSKLPMQVMLAMNIAHAVGNAILIYGFHFGTEGVAIPTLISRIAAAVIIITLALNKKQSIYIKKSLKHNFKWSMIKKILGIGVPYGLENGLFYLGRIVVLSLVATFGTAAIAANAVSGTIVMFEVLPGMSIGLGLTVIIL